MNIAARITETDPPQDQARRRHEGPVPLEPYRSASFFGLERDRIFRRAWLNIGRIEDVPDRGDFVTLVTRPPLAPSI